MNMDICKCLFLWRRNYFNKFIKLQEYKQCFSGEKQILRYINFQLKHLVLELYSWQSHPKNKARCHLFIFHGHAILSQSWAEKKNA